MISISLNPYHFLLLNEKKNLNLRYLKSIYTMVNTIWGKNHMHKIADLNRIKPNNVFFFKQLNFFCPNFAHFFSSGRKIVEAGCNLI